MANGKGAEDEGGSERAECRRAEVRSRNRRAKRQEPEAKSQESGVRSWDDGVDAKEAAAGRSPPLLGFDGTLPLDYELLAGGVAVSTELDKIHSGRESAQVQGQGSRGRAANGPTEDGTAHNAVDGE
jgi:hypothetical protein